MERQTNQYQGVLNYFEINGKEKVFEIIGDYSEILSSVKKYFLENPSLSNTTIYQNKISPLLSKITENLECIKTLIDNNKVHSSKIICDFLNMEIQVLLNLMRRIKNLPEEEIRSTLISQEHLENIICNNGYDSTPALITNLESQIQNLLKLDSENIFPNISEEEGFSRVKTKNTEIILERNEEILQKQEIHDNIEKLKKIKDKILDSNLIYVGLQRPLALQQRILNEISESKKEIENIMKFLIEKTEGKIYSIGQINQLFSVVIFVQRLSIMIKKIKNEDTEILDFFFQNVVYPHDNSKSFAKTMLVTKILISQV